MVNHLVFITEESSKVIFLQGLVPRIPELEGVYCEYRASDGFPDIRREVREVTRSWKNPHIRFVVLCDQDSANCEVRKSELLEQIAPHRRSHTLVRVVCKELESWYLGDTASIDELNTRVARPEHRFKHFADPDGMSNPSEFLKQRTKLGKRRLAESLGPIVDFERTQSPSLKVFLSGIRRLLAS